MSDKHKRHWFQFHLSTVIVGVVVVGCFLGPNVIERKKLLIVPKSVVGNCTYPETHMDYVARGWPFELSRRIPKTTDVVINNGNPFWFYDLLVYDIMIGIVLTCTVVLVYECWMRRTD